MSWLRYYAIAAALIYGYVTQLSLLLFFVLICCSAFLRSKQCGNKAFGMRRQGHVSLSLSFCFIIMHLLLYTYHHPEQRTTLIGWESYIVWATTGECVEPAWL